MFNSTTTIAAGRAVRAGTIAVAALTALGLSSGLGNQATADTGDNNANDNQKSATRKATSTDWFSTPRV